MGTREVPRDEWESFFDAFSKQHERWIATVEVLASEIGDQDESTRLPLVGISADVRGASRIDVIIGGRPDAHVTHVIDGPKRVWVTEREDGILDALEIESGDGKRTIVSFRRVSPVQADRQLPSG
jgi:hypothetical protein